MRRLLVGVGVLLSLVLTGCGSEEPRDLRVRSLTIVDDSSRVRASIAVNDSGSAELYIYDQGGNVHVGALVGSDGFTDLSVVGDGEHPASVSITVTDSTADVRTTSPAGSHAVELPPPVEVPEPPRQ